jgi:hypothetical protein
MNLVDQLKPEIDKLIEESKVAINNVKRIAIAEAWKILQLAVAKIIQAIEGKAQDLAGKDKKTTAMNLLSSFYDGVFVAVDIPMIPSAMEVLIHKYVKQFLMILVSSTIDAMVTTFRDVGVFNKHINSIESQGN